MPSGSKAAFNSRWMRSSGAFNGAKAPARLSWPLKITAWPPAAAATSRSVAAGALVHSQRCEPPHSSNCSPDSFSGGVVAGTDSRHNVAPACTALFAPRKNSSRWSRRPVQKVLASGSSMTSPPIFTRADCTAAAAPDRRSTSMPSHHALAFSGSGWPPHSLTRRMALACSASRRSVSVAGKRGSTFSETSQITPSSPSEPASARETS